MKLISTPQLSIIMTISQTSRIYSYISPRSNRLLQRYMNMLQSRNTHHTTRHIQQHYPPIKPISTTRLFSSTTGKESNNIKEQLDLDPYDILRICKIYKTKTKTYRYHIQHIIHQHHLKHSRSVHRHSSFYIYLN